MKKSLLCVLLALTFLVTLTACSFGGASIGPSKSTVKNDIDTAALYENCESAVFYEYNAVTSDGQYYDKYYHEYITTADNPEFIQAFAESFSTLKALDMDADKLREENFGPMWSYHFIKTDGSEIVFEQPIFDDGVSYILFGDKVYEPSEEWNHARSDAFYATDENKVVNFAFERDFYDYASNGNRVDVGRTVMADNGFNDIVDYTSEDNVKVRIVLSILGPLEPAGNDLGIGILEPNFFIVYCDGKDPLNVTFVTGNTVIVNGQMYYAERDVDTIYAEIVDFMQNS